MSLTRYKRLSRNIAGIFVLFHFLASPASCDDRISLLPALTVGQTLRYEVHGKVKRKVKTQSRVATMVEPRDTEEIDVSSILVVNIKEVRREKGHPASVVAQAEFLPFPNDAAPATAAAKHIIQFTITREGQLAAASGYDDLSAEQQLIWQFWFARFALPWTFPAGGVKPAEKWKAEEQEKSPAPIANIFWERETTYGQNDKCPVSSAERCAVFLTTASLKQKSSVEDSTPESFKLHQLKTSGSVKGSNEVITYLALRTGLLDRASEDLFQSMDVYIIQEDDSNQVHYTIAVTSHFEAVIVPANSGNPH